MTLRRLAVIAGMLTALVLQASTTGRINGFLKDAAGTAVADGKVTLTDNAKGSSVTVKADNKGSYTFPIVMPGAYKLHAEAPGFSPQDRTPVVVHVDSALRIDLTLESTKAAQ
jgi:hypothetical protein